MSVLKKDIDGVNRLLANFLSTFPSFVASTKGANIEYRVIIPLLEYSNEYCNDFQRYIIKSKIGEGGFGAVSTIVYKNKRLLAHNLSYKLSPRDSPAWTPYYMEVVVKRTKPQYLILRQKNNVYHASDMVMETLAGGFASNLFDLGIAPNLVKYFGNYVCKLPNSKRYVSNMIISRASTELFKIVDKVSRFDLEVILLQLSYTMTKLKEKFGIMHFDTHLRNLLITYVKDNYKYNIKKEQTVYVDGKSLEKVDYLLYQISGGRKKEYILVENTGIFMNLADWGLSMVDFGYSDTNNFENIKVMPELGLIDQVDNMREAVENVNGYGDVEYNFTCINILYNLVQRGNKKLFNDILPFIMATSNMESVMKKKFGGKTVEQRISIAKKTKKWFFSPRNVGTTPNKQNNLKAIGRLMRCRKQIHSTNKGNTVYYMTQNGVKPRINVFSNTGGIRNDDRIARISSSIKNPAKNAFDFEKYLKSTKEYHELCIRKPSAPISTLKRFVSKKKLVVPRNMRLNKDNYCELINLDRKKFNPNATHVKSLTNDVYNINYINQDNLDNYIVWKKGNDIKHFVFQLVPNERNGNLGPNLSIYYKRYHRMLNYQPPPKKLLGKGLRTNLHIIHIDKKVPGTVRVIKEDLWNNAFKNLGQYGVMINAGYFIVSKNLENPLTNKLKDRDIYLPIGYFYNKNTPRYNGVRLPIPEGYRKHFAAIYFQNGKIKAKKYNEFIKAHVTGKKTILFKTKNVLPGQKTTHVARQIDVIKAPPKLKNGKKLFYESAFASGPILIWDSKIVFNDKNLRDDAFEATYKWGKNKSTLVSYKLLPIAKNTKKFYNEPGETDFVYGQRHSNSLVNLNAICWKKSGDPFFAIIEGRGFETLGLDRVQFAKILKNFGVRYAVSLDGGFSANAVFKDVNQKYPNVLKWAVKDPEKRELSAAMLFGDIK